LRASRRIAIGLAVGSVLLFGGAGVAAAVPVEAMPEGYLKQTLTKPDGSILAVGLSDEKTRFLVQVKSDGSVDREFSDGGMALLPETPGGEFVDLLPAQGEGSFLATRSSLVESFADGSPKRTFGLNLGDDLGEFGITAAGIQSDGKPVIAGDSSLLGTFVARFERDGTLDETFGDGGISDPSASFPPDGRLSPRHIVFDGQDRIVITGKAHGTAGVLRLLPDGVPDPGYGPDGHGFSVGAPAEMGSTPAYLTRPFIDADGSLRIYGRSFPYTYWTQSLTYSFDQNGLPIQAVTNVDGSGTTIETGGKGLVRAATSPEVEGRGSVLPRFGVNVGSRDVSGPQKKGRVFPLAPDSAAVMGLEYVAADDSVVAVGGATGFSCEPECTTRSYPVIAKVDADTGRPIAGFGTGGAVLVPENECVFGKGGSPFHPVSPWRRCRATPPAIDGRINVIRGKQGPRLHGRVTLSAPQSSPELGFTLRVKLPAALRLKASKGRAKVYSSTPDATVWLNRRMITVVTERPEYTWVAYEEPPPPNEPVTLEFGLRGGSMKAIPRKLRRKQMRFPVKASSLPAIFNTEDFGAVRWYADGKSSGVLTARAR